MALDHPGAFRYIWSLLGWNILGLLDILGVVVNAVRLLIHDPSFADPFMSLPLAILPTFVVPIVIVSHVLLFSWTRRSGCSPEWIAAR